MKIHLYIYILLILILQSCGQEGSNEEVNHVRRELDDEILPANKEVYDLINAAIQLNEIGDLGNLKFRILDSLPADPYGYSFLDDNELLKKYSRFDTVSLYQAELLVRLSKLKTFKLDSNKLPQFEIFSSDSIDFNRSFSENINTEPFLLFYSPLISVDGKLAIISIDHICFGLCGEGWSLILIKENDKWIKIGEIFRWVS
ncbi:hypothetical protein [Algoriphagus sp. CAU 1675]|uniref:hypothetical protein n=1 Tax=Algoriphagus sp. CAU 1675 TaxID=3032597 RepID=UPI0023DCAFB3|nr:hypothetical protein [Algoriphagus sp. CAU 1675]MDF2159064.1 hypothetical protein [Algoriphagus sp. CAU 1675]